MANIKREEYEVISHNAANFHVFLVSLLYRTPHAHKDFEIGMVVEGRTSLVLSNQTCVLEKNSIFVLNPYQSHELISQEPALILSIQIPPGFFEVFFPKISYLTFLEPLLPTEKNAFCAEIRQMMLRIAKEYFYMEELYEFRCATLLNRLFYTLLQNAEIMYQSEQQRSSNHAKGTRLRKIMHYIDAHYTEKILLSDIAEAENLDLFYLSHFFKENFGVPFQTYVNRLRCEHARQQLLVTDYSLLDISINSGFSDPKYFNKSFRELYGCSPREYRQNFTKLELAKQQKSMLSTQEFLSPGASIVTLGL